MSQTIVFTTKSEALEEIDDRMARRVTLAIWVVMAGLAFAMPVLTVQNVPIGADWDLVQPPAPGAEDAPGIWNWSALRTALLPAVILRGAFSLVRADLRLAMLLNVALVAALAFAALTIARRIRGHASLTDAFFPILLLNWGRAESFGWMWQLGQVLPVAVAGALALTLAHERRITRAIASLIAGAGVLLLAVAGSIGPWLAFPLALWCLGRVVGKMRRKRFNDEPEWATVLLSLASLAALYLAGVRLFHAAPPAGQPSGLAVGLELVALGLGPASASAGPAASLASIAVVLASLAVGVASLRRRSANGQPQLLATVVFLVIAVCATLAIGWRGGDLRGSGIGTEWPPRFSIVAVPALIASYLIWVQGSSGRVRAAAEWGFLTTVILFLPFNTLAGLDWRRWYVEGMSGVERDIFGKVAASLVAERNGDFLAPGLSPADLAGRMRQLRALPGPLGELQRDQQEDARPPAEATWPAGRPIVGYRIEHRVRGGGQADLVWGVAGWATMPERFRPPGTRIANRVMNSPMQREGDAFVLDLKVPDGFPIDYGILVLRRSDGLDAVVWDAGYRATVAAGGTSRTQAPSSIESQLIDPPPEGLVEVEVRYRQPEAGAVALAWRDEGKPSSSPTVTPMDREHNTFVAKVKVHPGTKLRYGFLINRTRAGAAIQVADTGADYTTSIARAQTIELTGIGTVKAERPTSLPALLVSAAVALFFFVAGGWAVRTAPTETAA